MLRGGYEENAPVEFGLYDRLLNKKLRPHDLSAMAQLFVSLMSLVTREWCKTRYIIENSSTTSIIDCSVLSIASN